MDEYSGAEMDLKYNSKEELFKRVQMHEEVIRRAAILSIAAKRKDSLIVPFLNLNGEVSTQLSFNPITSSDLLPLRHFSCTVSNYVYNEHNNFVNYCQGSRKWHSFDEIHEFMSADDFDREEHVFQLGCLYNPCQVVRFATMAYVREYGLESGYYQLEHVLDFTTRFYHLWSELELKYWGRNE